jgi:alkaline phosphatase D
MAYLKSQYEVQKQKPEYQQLVRSCRVIGTWGDNNYGMKNGNGSYSRKAESQQLFLDFLDEPKHSPRRKQKGVYGSYILGEPGRQIKIILLDEFYHAQEPGPENDLLGEEQWTWFADETRLCFWVQVSSFFHLNILMVTGEISRRLANDYSSWLLRQSRT